MRPSARCIGLFLLALTGTSIAEGRRLRLDYRAPPSCPTATVFEAEVWRRLSPEGVRATEQRSLGVTIAQDALGYRGTLRVSESSDGASGRELGSADCGELVRALALVAAVVLNPAEGTPAVPAVPAPATSVAPVIAEPKAAPVATPAYEPAPRPSSPRGRVVVVGAVAGGLQSGIGGDLVWSPRIALGAEYHSIHWPWGVGVRFSGSRATGDTSTSLGTADFVWTSGRVELCPIWRASGGVMVSACGLVEAGEVRGSIGTTQKSHSLLAPGGLVRVEGRAFWPLWLYGDVGVTRPLARAKFFIQGQGGEHKLVYQLPEVVLAAGLGLLVRWP